MLPQLLFPLLLLCMGRSEPPARWQVAGTGICKHSGGMPYGQEVQAKAPAAYRASWGPDASPGKPDRGYGYRYCCTAADVKADCLPLCQSFCEQLGDCVAISSGSCCFPYRATCSKSSRDDASNSQSYIYYEIIGATIFV